MSNDSFTTLLIETQAEVSSWSLVNFGNQQSKLTGATLGSLASLLGLVEELGERQSASSHEEHEDAVADILIFLLDYLSREDVAVDNLPDGDGTVPLIVSVGKLAHCTLKRHQGIRGYCNTDKYNQARNQACADILARLVDTYGHSSLMRVLSATWKQVKQRHWAKTANADS